LGFDSPNATNQLKFNKMKANYKVLAKINVELFYAVTIYKWSIRLQGEQSSETIKYLNKVFNVSKWTISESGYMEALIEVDGVKIEIVLT
jgi:hypothetical protein